jgi:hypothetical protein
MRRFWWFCAALVFLSLALASFTQDLLHASYLSHRTGVPGEFLEFYKAAQLARRGEILYYPPPDHAPRNLDELRFDRTTPYGGETYPKRPAEPPMTVPFVSPPFSALLMEPLSSLPWQVAYFEWRVLTALACFMAVFFSSRLRGDRTLALASFAAGVGVLTVFYPFKEEIYLGEIDGLVLLAWVAGTWLFLRRRPAASSFCFAVGTAIKVFPVLVVPLMLVRRQWRWLGYYLLWGSVLLGLSIDILGWPNHALWLTRVAPLLSCGFEYFGNRSLSGFIVALCRPHGMLIYPEIPRAVCWVNKALCGLLFASFLWWCWSKRKTAQALTYELLLMMLVCLVVSPLTWREYYLFAVPPLLYLWVGTYEESGQATKSEIGLLSAATLVCGTPLLDYVAAKLGLFFLLLVMGLWLGATLGLIWLGMRLYNRIVPPPQPVGSS